MRPLVLLPGDALLYHGVDWLGNAIEGFEWQNHPNEAVQFCHIASVYDDKRLIRQNPGGPAFENLDDQPWGRMQAFRFTLEGKTPGKDPLWIENFKKSVDRHMKDVYAYHEFGDYLVQDAQARFGIKVSPGEDWFGKLLMLTGIHPSVCSGFYRYIIEEPTQETYLPKFDLFDGRIPEGEAKPSDIPTSKYEVSLGDMAFPPDVVGH